jgi:hypothetical protein
VLRKGWVWARACLLGDLPWPKSSDLSWEVDLHPTITEELVYLVTSWGRSWIAGRSGFCKLVSE